MARFLLNIVIVGLLFGCDSTSRDYVDVNLKNKRLEDAIAGQWIKEFEISYETSASPLKHQILERLLQEGEILADYHVGRHPKKNVEHIVVVLWNDHTFVLNEYLSEYYGSGYHESDLWISLLLLDKPCKQLLEGDRRLGGSHDNLHKATISSSADHARLFLFGLGESCERISLY